MISRADYMVDSAHLHSEYFSQFVTQGTRDQVAAQIGLERIKVSTDPYFNDIPLKEWDQLTGYNGCSKWKCDLICHTAKIKEADEWLTLNTLVCIAKEAARQLKETSE